MRKLLVAAAALALVSTGASAQVNVVGTTTGCFYTAPDAPCAVGLANTNFNGLISYTGGFFNVTVGPGTNYNFDGDVNDNIGLLNLIGSPATLGTSYLRLFVSFSTPALATPTDILLGDFIVPGNAPPRLEVDFSEAYTLFQYGPNPLQMFEFRGSEGPVTTLVVGESEYLGFRVDCVHAMGSGTAACLAPPAGGAGEFAVVTPEPSTYALMAAGLLGLVGVARRRNRNA